MVGVVAFGSVIAHTAVLLVFQLGQPRIFFAMSRDGLLPPFFSKVHPRFRTPHVGTIITGVFVGVTAMFTSLESMVDLTNIGTLFAFVLVCLGVLVLRHTEPDRPRPFRVPLAWPVCIAGAAACIFVMKGLPTSAWERFGIWLAIGLVLYFAYGYRHSRLRATD
jgi:APA family basic amino acid/polyamine antiporter